MNRIYLFVALETFITYRDFSTHNNEIKSYYLQVDESDECVCHEYNVNVNEKCFWTVISCKDIGNV